MEQYLAIVISVISAAVSALMAIFSYSVTRHMSKPSIGIDNWDMKYVVNKKTGEVSVAIRVFVNRKTDHFNHEKPSTWAV
jgi:hypothetical protein